MIIIPLSELLCHCQNPKNEANERHITDFGRSQLQEQLLCCTHTVKNGGFISQNTPEDKQASLHRCMFATKKQPGQTTSSENCRGTALLCQLRQPQALDLYKLDFTDMVTAVTDCLTQPTRVHYWYAHGQMLLKPWLSDSWSAHTPQSPSPPPPVSKVGQNAAHPKPWLSCWQAPGQTQAGLY